MNVSRIKIASFFFAILLLGWFLYPKALFLGYIYEGRKELHQSEKYYLKHLERHPHNKFVTYRLASVYERMALPEKGVVLLEKLYQHRKKDWSIANAYLDYVEGIRDENLLCQLRLRVAENFMKIPRFSKRYLEELLYPAMEYLLWKQRTGEAITILKKLIRLSNHPKDYYSLLLDLNQGLKNTKEVLSILEARVKEEPKEEFLRIDWSAIVDIVGDFEKALQILNEGLDKNPKSHNFLRARIDYYQKHHNIDAAIRDLEFFLSMKDLQPGERLDGSDSLATLYEKKGNFTKALHLFQLVRRIDPSNPLAWKSIIFLYEKMGRISDYAGGMENYLEKFPDDVAISKTLAEAYLYLLKDPAPFDFYLRYVTLHPTENFAIDVADLYADAEMPELEERWLKDVAPIFSSSVKLVTRSAAFYEKYFRRAEAISVFERALRKNNHPLLWAKLFHLHEQSGSFEVSKKYLAMLTPVAGKETSVLRDVGIELLAAGQIPLARSYFMKARGREPQNPELTFWSSEGAIAMGEWREGRRFAGEVVDLLKNEKRRSASEDRFYWKAKSRLQPEFIGQNYSRLRKKYPKEIDFYIDPIELLMDAEKYADAREGLEMAWEQFPKEDQLWHSTAVTLAFAEQDWEKAIRLLETISKKYPLWSTLRDLAEAHQRAGHWQDAITQYAALKKKYGNFPIFSAPLRELHEKYDSRWTPRFRFIDYGADESREWGIAASQFLSEKWKGIADIQTGFYRSPIRGFEEGATLGKFGVAFHPIPRWEFHGASGFGASSMRTLPTFWGGAAYQIPEQFKISLEGEFSKLRMDFPQAVAVGVAQSGGRLEWEYFLFPRLTMAGKYQLERSDIPGPAHAYEHLLEPVLSWVASKKPTLTFSYQYTFVEVLDRNRFLAAVPLISRIRAHYLGGGIAHRWNDRLVFEGGFFIGEDTERGLHIVEGDLMGASGRAVWNLARWLDLDLSYHYGKETSPLSSGRSQEVFMKFSSHYGKENFTH